jgi:hypothetical protein
MPSENTVRAILEALAGPQVAEVRTPPKAEGTDSKHYPASAEAAAEQRAQISSAIAIDPTQSNRALAKKFGCSDRTVAKVRKGPFVPRSNGTDQPQAPEKPVAKAAGTTAPPDPVDRRDAAAFAKDLEATLERALARHPEAFIDLLPKKRQADLTHILNRFCAWATIATGEQQS